MKKIILLIVLPSLLILQVMINDFFMKGPAKLENFTIIFLSVLIETFPFLLLGILASALFHYVLSERAVYRLIPKNPVKGMLGVSLMGMYVPICSCGTVPLARGLIRRGIPPRIALISLFAIPIINPLTALSTAFAFHFRWWFVFTRLGVGFLLALVVGNLLGRFFRGKDILTFQESSCQLVCEYHPHEEKGKRVFDLFHSMSEEFFTLGTFLILGAFLTAFLQAYLPKDVLMALGKGRISSIGIMSILGFSLSLCSTADAFIAASFQNLFTPYSLIVFMLVGPTISIKNVLVMMGVFKGKVIGWMIFLTFLFLFLLGIWIK